MTSYVAGATATLTVEWDQYPGGPATDVTGLTITVKTIDGVVIIGPTSTGIVHVATGLYSYDWAIPVDQHTGDYVAVWDATNSLSQPISTFEVFTVTSGTWCTVSDVPGITGGLTATTAEVQAAQAILEGVIHRVWRVTDATKRDHIWLQRACAFQAAYVHQHLEILTMMGIQSWSQDGMSFSLDAGNGMKAYLAPLALLQLNALFRGSNSTIRFNSAFQKNRVGQQGAGFGGSVPWTDI